MEYFFKFSFSRRISYSRMTREDEDGKTKQETLLDSVEKNKID